jgi:cell division protein ZapE
VPRAARGVAWFPFEELCAKPLGAADYLALATHYHTVIVDGVPKFTEARRNEAKRFITLIDALYEHKTYAVIAAEAAPDRLYTGETHAFEFERTGSRLMEMQSADYLERRHLT